MELVWKHYLVKMMMKKKRVLERVIAVVLVAVVRVVK
jgi:hypothetical protein